jgi:hypothetical protein
MPIIRTPIVDDNGSGTTGTVLNNAWKQELYGQIDGVVGVPVAVPFNATRYGAYPSGSWTVAAGNMVLEQYTIIGRTGIYQFYLTDSTIAGAVQQLTLPNPVPGVTSACVGFCGIGGAEVATAYTNNAAGTIFIIRQGIVNFVAGSTGNVRFTLIMTV